MPHLLGIRDTAAGPEATFAEGTVWSERLDGPFSWRLSAARTCIGSFGWEDGVPTYCPCPGKNLVTTDAQCGACCPMAAPDCVFEPRCKREGTPCACPEFQAEHVVYISFFSTLPKVGLTQRRRLAARLREQGADAGFVVQGGLDRGAARRLEESLHAMHHVPQHRSWREVLPQLARPVPWDIVAARAAAWQQALMPRHAVEPELLRPTHSAPQPLPRPHRRPPYGPHAGSWLGMKGNHLFYRAASPLGTGEPVAALKATDLAGRHVERMQASLPGP